MNVLSVDVLGKVTKLNPIQYTIAALLTPEGLENKVELYKILWILLYRSDISILNHVDSEDNSCLHYCALLSDINVVNFMIGKSVNVVRNKRKEKAFVYAKNLITKRTLETYCNTDFDVKQLESIKNKNVVFEKEMKTKKHEDNESFDDNENCDSTSSSAANNVMRLKPYKHNVEKSAKTENDQTNNVKIRDENNTNIKAEINTNIKADNNAKIKLNDFNHTVNDFETEKIYVQKYPGKMYISINTIIGFYCEQVDVNAVAVQVCVNGQEQTTNLHVIGSHIDIGETFIFNIEQAPIKIKVYMVVEYANTISRLFGSSKATKKVLKSKLNMTELSIDKYHNKLVTHEFHWQQYNAPSLLYVIKELFGKKSPNASVLHTFMSFISDDEFQHIDASVPYDLYTLSNWIKYRQNSFITWYKGYVTIRGDKSAIATLLWKRRFIQWHGYNIMIFNATSGAMVGIIDISQAMHIEIDENSKSYELRNTIRLKIENSSIEIQFDNKDKYETAMLALKTVLYC
ncbi:hypothetical protein BDAP_000486 [Binucleata daphniae]